MEFKDSKPQTAEEKILTNFEVDWFIKSRKFKQEDLPLLFELSKFNKNMLNTNFHNSFQFWEGRTETELLRLKKRTEEENNPENTELLRAIDIYLYVLKNYDQYAVDHLNRLIEGLK